MVFLAKVGPLSGPFVMGIPCMMEGPVHLYTSSMQYQIKILSLSLKLR
jgi:hypothetical protein